MQKVELIASGYEFTCPKCGLLNTSVIEVTEKVICACCKTEFEVSEYHHAIG